MVDTVSPEVRSRMMAANRRRDTRPELMVRRYLHAQGLRYRLDVRKLPGSPDIVLARYRAVIFVHGCFWHRHEGCRFAAEPKSNQDFWAAKFAANIERDRNATTALNNANWRVGIVWECALRGDSREQALAELLLWIQGKKDFAVLPSHGPT
ncbi:very short patch repair endonuclease [Aquimixticola soesokkakensis]|uniref:very short patch repair endonuclease n=1 Tax=Aquimixticola soesokkakensis TaxID=1519096 RepID=UPI000A2678A7|nr:very short patch repair endonuclease [Aquimixticola soesokkakensis]